MVGNSRNFWPSREIQVSPHADFSVHVSDFPRPAVGAHLFHAISERFPTDCFGGGIDKSRRCVTEHPDLGMLEQGVGNGSVVH